MIDFPYLILVHPGPICNAIRSMDLAPKTDESSTRWVLYTAIDWTLFFFTVLAAFFSVQELIFMVYLSGILYYNKPIFPFPFPFPLHPTPFLLSMVLYITHAI